MQFYDQQSIGFMYNEKRFQIPFTPWKPFHFESAEFTKTCLKNLEIICRGVARGGWGRDPPENWQISKPYANYGGRGADYARHTTTSPLRFKILSTPLIWEVYLPSNAKKWIHNQIIIDKTVPSNLVLPWKKFKDGFLALHSCNTTRLSKKIKWCMDR